MKKIIAHFRAKPEQIATFLKQRNISQSDAEKYGLCYFPDRYALPEFIRQNESYYREINFLNESGHPILHNRIGIPMNSDGIACRDISGKSEQKYITLIDKGLRKSDLLYRLDENKEAIKQAGYAIVTEGQIDEWAFEKVGLNNVVSSYSAIFSKEQAQLLSRHTDLVYLCFDNDTAGRRASITGWINALESKLKVLFVNKFGDCSDPDEYINKYGRSGIDTLLSQPDDMYKIFRNLNDETKEKFLEKIIDSFSSIADIEYISDIFLKFNYCPKKYMLKLLKRIVKTFENAEIFSYVVNPKNNLYADKTVYAMLYWLGIHKEKNGDMKDHLPMIKSLPDYRISTGDIMNILLEYRR